MRISLNGLKASEIPLMLEELGNPGEVKDPQTEQIQSDVTLLTSASEDDISAVLCFVLGRNKSASTPTQSEPAVAEAWLFASAAVAAPEPALAPVANAAPPPPNRRRSGGSRKRAKASESTSIRVAVEKVDQLINLKEPVITQPMLAQRSGTLDPVNHGDPLNSMSQLERNARDLQESVM